MAEETKRNDLFKRLTQLFRGGTTVRRKVRAFRTPTASTAAEVFKKSYSQVYSNALNAYGQYDRMSLRLQTLIAVPGAEGFVTLEELIKRYPDGEKFVVYAFDHEKGHVVPAWAHHPRQTDVKPTVKVIFDDGSELICTSNHPCMLRDGSYRNAEDLKPGDSMMPFYRKQFNGTSKDDGKKFRGYRSIYTCGPMEGSWHNWMSEHRLIAEWSQQRKLVKGEEHIHHADHNPENNEPSNLEFVNAKEHLSEHGKMGARVWETKREKMIEGLKRAWDEDDGSRRAAVADVNRRDDVRAMRRGHWKTNNPSLKKLHPVIKELTLEKLVDVAVKAKKKTLAGVAEVLGCPKHCLQHFVFGSGKSWTWVQERAKQEKHSRNHSVVSVEPWEVLPVGDLTVDGFENFATDTIFTHNSRYADFSEMGYTPEISSALDIYSEESCSSDDKGSILHIFSENPKIYELLDELYHDTLNVDYNLTPWTRNLVKYGDLFLFNDVHPEQGVINAFPMPVNEVEREEGWDPKDPLAVRFRWVTQGNQILEAWQVSHFRLMGNDAFLPYGSSILESARRIWRQLILIEDAMLVYRVVRSPERRVFYIDVGTVPPEEIANYMEAAQTKLKRAPVVDKATGKMDLRYNPLPVWSQSRIPLLDGRTITVQQLAQEHDEGKDNWVYSVQDKTHRIVPGKVVWCGKNYTADKLVKVRFDDDTWVMTAPEHPFLMRDGSKKRADELKPSDSLMPFYRRMSTLDAGDYAEGYEQLYEPGTNEWGYTHKLVSSTACVDFDRVIDEGVVTHHINHRKWDNRPTNLQRMGWFEHKRHHAEANRSPEHREMVALHNRRHQKAQKMGAAYNGTSLHKEHNAIRSQVMIEMWADEGRRAHAQKNMRREIPQSVVESTFELIRQNPSINRHEATVKLRTDASVMEALCSASTTKRNIQNFHVSSVVSVFKLTHGIKGWTDFKRLVLEEFKRNHSVSRIEWVDVADDVFCMTVVGPRGEDDRHNFACLSEGNAAVIGSLEELSRVSRQQMLESARKLNGGVFLGNSVDEDYFIPIRGGDTGTRIDTLAGGQHVSDIADVEYIQKKLFAALKVPRAYLGYDESLSSKATLAQEDIRFSRSIAWIQKVLVSELEKLGIIHLYAHGFEGEELLDFKLQLSNPSTVAQMQKLELWRTKFEIAGTVPENLVDREFILKELFSLPDARIERIKKGRRSDRLEDLELEAEELEGNTPSGGGGGGGGLGGLGGLGDLEGGGDQGMGASDAGGPAGGAASAGGEPGGSSEEPKGGDEDKGEDLFAGDKQPDDGLLTSADVPTEDADAPRVRSLDNVLRDIDKARKAPVKASPLSRSLYNKSRERTHGPMKTMMPSFKDVVMPDDDPFDRRFFRQGPFRESFDPTRSDKLMLGELIIDDTLGARPRKLSAEMRSALASMEKRIGITRRRVPDVLVESMGDNEEIDVELDDDVNDILLGNGSDDGKSE